MPATHFAAAEAILADIDRAEAEYARANEEVPDFSEQYARAQVHATLALFVTHPEEGRDMTPGDAVVKLDAMDANDPERVHNAADDILLQVVPGQVREAYVRLVKRADWWAA